MQEGDEEFVQIVSNNGQADLEIFGYIDHERRVLAITNRNSQIARFEDKKQVRNNRFGTRDQACRYQTVC